MIETAVETLTRLFPDTADWEPVSDDLWRGQVSDPPRCWRYVMLRDRRYSTVLATHEFVRDAIGATDHITWQLGEQYGLLAAADEPGSADPSWVEERS